MLAGAEAFSPARCTPLAHGSSRSAKPFRRSVVARRQSAELNPRQWHPAPAAEPVTFPGASTNRVAPHMSDHDEVTFRPGCSIPQPVRYSTRDWMHVLRTWPSSKLWQRIAPAVLTLTLWATALTFVHKTMFPVLEMTMAPHTLMGTAISLLLVYRTNSANDRFMEGRRMWERVVRNTREMSALCVAHMKHLGVPRVVRISRLLSAFAITLTDYVVGPDTNRNTLPLWRVVPDQEALLMAGTPPLRVTQLMLAETTRIANSGDGLWTNRERGMLAAIVAELQHAVAQGERLVQTPIPQSYVRHTTRLLTLWLATLPFALVHVVGWWTPAVVWAIAWALIGINDLGLGIEHPFDGPQSLRMAVMCNTAHAAVTDAMHLAAFPRFAGLTRAFLEREFAASGGVSASKEQVLAGGQRPPGPSGAGHHGGAGGTKRAAPSSSPSLAEEVCAKDELLGRTALHHAAYAGDRQLVCRLLHEGAAVNAEDSWDGSTPLDVARAQNHKDVAQLLLAAGAASQVFGSSPLALPYSETQTRGGGRACFDGAAAR